MNRRLIALCVVAACSKEAMTSTRTPDPSRSVTIDIPFCSAVAPEWVAFQDGDGAWTRALPVVVGQKTRFRFTFGADRGAIAVGRILELGRAGALSVQYGRPDELIMLSDTAAANCGPAAMRTLLGTAAGIDTNELAAVSAGFGAGALLGPGQSKFSLQRLAPGPQVVLATRFSRVSDTKQLTRIILRRTPDLPDSTVLSPFDFNSAEAFAPALANATLAGVDVEGAILATGLLTPVSQSFLAAFDEATTGARRTIVAIPGERLRDGELQIATVVGLPSEDTRRSASVYFRDPGDQLLTLGAPMTMPALSTISTTPSLHLRAVFDAQPDYDRLTSIVFIQEQTTVSVAATAAYATLAATGYTLVMPDLSGVSGFDARWALRGGAPVFWTAQRVGGTLALGLDAQPFPGATRRSADRFGTFNP